MKQTLKTRRFLRSMLTAGLAVASTVALTACSGNTASTSGGDDIKQGLNTFDSVEAYQPAVDLLPASVKDAGTLKVVMNVGSAPTKFFDTDGSTIIGLNPDVARLLGKTLGMNVDIENVQFDGIIPALEASRFDFAVASMATSADRVKVLDMIDYGHWGSVLVTPSSGSDLNGEEDMCGKQIGVQQGSFQQNTTLPKVNQTQCLDNGKPAINVVTLPSMPEALVQLNSKRLDGVVGDTPNMTYSIQQQPDLKIVGPVNKSGDTTVTLATKSGSDLTPALTEAMKHVITLPEYKESFSAWGLQDSTVSEVGVHTATQP
ncbi:transporter substrate-binding domain-containing protein [Pseudoclavibacter sp. CFCC 14310]|uniref:transporter substrate-binding domain-containing protein n=1 Tax=Pseudoclavibacter sp. CFCC 14310 TaxID=2615180 RepID=UPI0013013070|nr:transporter substrate-binding domain-containing protein [Pseudoclavibacter sp. CFCC 14310]KAB1644591.1 transporter substrate-binding domain-containing protein [Pseudoclavibacter sp. CFCC 14310]